MESLTLADWNARLAALHRRAAAVAGLEGAMVEYQSAGGGLPLPVVCAACPEYPARGRKVKDGQGKAA
jgi:hypothetical protein